MEQAPPIFVDSVYQFLLATLVLSYAAINKFRASLNMEKYVLVVHSFEEEKIDYTNVYL